MNFSTLFLSMIDRYIKEHFHSLVGSSDSMDTYVKLMEIRNQLQSEVAQIQKEEAIQNSRFAKIVKKRNERAERRAIRDALKGITTESMKLTQFLPHR